MRLRRLSCFEDFHCLAGACSDTCCAGWEIDLDPEILKTYEDLPGPLGEEIRGRITEEDGYTFFQCQNGKCPFLDEGLLCRLITAAGGEQSLLSEVCREHPRFHEEYGSLRETCLAISCPEVARLLLESGPVRVISEENGESAQEPLTEADAALVRMLETERERLLRNVHLQDGPMEERLERLSASGMRLQRRLDACLEAEANGLSYGDGETEEPGEPGKTGKPGKTGQTRQEDLRPWLEAMQRMEFTDDRLPRLLEQALRRSGPLVPVIPGEQTIRAENLVLYFLYRYFLKAAWDEDLLGKVGFAVRSVQTIFLLAPEAEAADPSLAGLSALEEAAVRYSREVEHSDENLELLYDAVWAQCANREQGQSTAFPSESE